MLQDKYWIDPDGNIAEVTDRHIIAILTYPEKFGLTSSYVKAVHKKHREKPGSEGNAREEILSKLMDLGWIRLRYIPREDFWGIQVSQNSPLPHAARLRDWAKFIIKKQKGSPTSYVKVFDLKPELLHREMTLQEVAAGGLEERRRRGLFAEYRNPSRSCSERGRTKRKASKYGLVTRR